VTILSKSLQTLGTARTPSGVKQAAAWAEARSVYPIYLTLAKQFDLGLPFANEKRTFPEQPEPEVSERVLRWLNEMDQQVQVYQLRQVLQTTTLNASENSLRSLIFRHLHKAQKTPVDRDKIDFLLVQYFALCAPPKMYHKQVELSDVALVLQPVLGNTDATPLEWCEPLEKMITTLQGFHSLREILSTRFIEQGRKVKDAAGGMFYDPSALLAFVRFNFLLRRTFIELMHTDLIAVRAGLIHLEEAGVRTLACPSLGLPHASVTHVRQMADAWKQPFQKEYTETAVNNAFERLLALRTDVEKALELLHGKSVSAPPIHRGRHRRRRQRFPQKRRRHVQQQPRRRSRRHPAPFRWHLQHRAPRCPLLPRPHRPPRRWPPRRLPCRGVPNHSSSKRAWRRFGSS